MGERIGFIGLGRMGARMCGRLLDAGHTLTVYDVSAAAVDAIAQRGAKTAQNAAQVASAAEVVFASLPSPSIVQDAVLGKAVDFLKQQGYTKVRNMKGGILAWSDKVDPTVPKY